MPGPDGLVWVLRVAGEVDLSSIDLLRTALGSVRRSDLRTWSWIWPRSRSAAPAGLLCWARPAPPPSDAGPGTRWPGHRPRLNWVWAMGWTAAERPIGFPTVAGAVLAAMAHQVGQQDRAQWEPKQLISADTSPARDTAVPLVARVPVPAPVEFA